MPPGLAHDILGYRDVLECICQHCDRTGTLFFLALTCHATSESALDALWHTIYDIIPLIRCMPDDLWTVTNAVIKDDRLIDRRVRQLSFRRPVLPSDWTRFNVNAARVREISIYCQHGSYGVVQPEVYQALIYATHSPLIPSIKGLIWNCSDVDASRCVKLFISPTLGVLHLMMTNEYGAYDASRFSLLASLPILCPSISVLELNAQPCRDSTVSGDRLLQDEIPLYTSTALSAIQNLTHLQRLSFSFWDIEDNAFCNVISLSGLRYLSIANTPPHGFRPPASQATRNCLSCLEHLKLLWGSVEFAMWMVANMWQTPLETITLEFSQTLTVANLKTLFLTMRDKIVHGSLRQINISSIGNVRSGMVDIGLTMAHLTPLLSFMNLTSMHLEYVAIALDDDDITRISLAWPRLELLRIDQPAESLHVMTLKGLAALAQNCQALAELRLPLDTSNAVQDELDLGNIACNQKLRYLDVQTSPIDNPSVVAAVLYKLFPNLQTLYSIKTRETWKWDQVRKSIKKLAGKSKR